MILNSLDDPINWTPVVRTADKSVNNSTTIASDGVLQFDVVGGEAYLVEACLVYTGVGDLRWQMSPSAGSIGGSLSRLIISTAGIAAILSSAFGAQTAAGSSGGSTKYAMLLSGIVHPTLDATISLTWAQQTATVGDLTMKAGSFIRVKKV